MKPNAGKNLHQRQRIKIVILNITNYLEYKNNMVTIILQAENHSR